MNYKIAILLLLSIPVCAYAEIKHGLELAPVELRQHHLEVFIGLFEEYCYGKESRDEVKIKLENSENFSASKKYEGVYEAAISGLIYGITPESDACVVDILLEYESGKLLFSLNEIIPIIESVGTYNINNSKEIMELGPSEQKVLTSEIRFYEQNKNTNEIVLTYPLNNQDSWYMTLSYKYK